MSTAISKTRLRNSQGHGLLLNCVTVAVFPSVPSATVTVVAWMQRSEIQEPFLEPLAFQLRELPPGFRSASSGLLGSLLNAL